MPPTNITQIHKTSQINSEYIPKYNLTFPPNQNCHVLINFAHEVIAKMTEDPNSAVMHEIMCVQINTYFDTIFKNPWFLNGAPTF